MRIRSTSDRMDSQLLYPFFSIYLIIFTNLSIIQDVTITTKWTTPPHPPPPPSTAQQSLGELHGPEARVCILELFSVQTQGQGRHDYKAHFFQHFLIIQVMWQLLNECKKSKCV